MATIAERNTLQAAWDLDEVVRAYHDGGYKLAELVCKAVTEARQLKTWEGVVFRHEVVEELKRIESRIKK